MRRSRRKDCCLAQIPPVQPSIQLVERLEVACDVKCVVSLLEAEEKHHSDEKDCVDSCDHLNPSLLVQDHSGGHERRSCKRVQWRWVCW